MRQGDRRGLNRGLVLALAVAALGAGCSGDGGTADTTTTAPTTAAPTTSTTAPKSVTTAPVVPNMKPDEIAIRNLMDLYQAELTAALEDPDPSRPALLALVTSPFAEHLVATLTRFKNDGTYYRRADGGISPHRTNSVTFLDPSTARANVCVRDDTVGYQKGKADPIDTAANLVLFESTVRRGTDGQWRIAEHKSHDKGTSAANCGGL